MYYMLTLLSVSLLATGGIFVKLSSLGPITTGFYRVFIAYLVIAGFELYLKKPTYPVSFKTRITLLLAGAALGFDLFCWNISFHHTSVTNANLLVNLAPLFSIPLSYLLFQIKITSRQAICMMMMLVGVIILLCGKVSFSGDQLYGDGLALLTAFFYAIYLMIISFSPKDISFLSLVKYVSLGSSIVLLPLSLLLEDAFMVDNAFDFLPLLGLALIAHIGGQGLLTSSMKQIGIVYASLILLVQPLFASLYSYILFHETLTLQETIGISIILVSIYFSKKKKNPSISLELNKTPLSST